MIDVENDKILNLLPKDDKDEVVNAMQKVAISQYVLWLNNKDLMITMTNKTEEDILEDLRKVGFKDEEIVKIRDKLLEENAIQK